MEHAMPRYYFDVRANDNLVVDDKGVEFPDVRGAEIQATRSVGEMASDIPPGTQHHHVAIEVRTDYGRAFKAAFTFDLTRQ